MTSTTCVRPTAICFSTDRIRDRFQHGMLEDTFNELLDSKEKLDNIPPITVMDCAKRGQRRLSGPDYMVLDGNRRLYLYRKLEALKEITEVKVVVVDFDAEFHSTRILFNSGKEVLVRSGLEERLLVLYQNIQLCRHYLTLALFFVAVLLTYIF